MDQKGSYTEIDPDYSSHNIALQKAGKLKEENSNSLEKLREILTEEFNKELSQRQTQIEYIENQIYKTQKLLHLLKYVLISSYYNRKDLEYNNTECTYTNSTDSNHLFDQNRIHPALKKLLGKNPTAQDLNICRSARRIKTENKPNLLVENLNGMDLKPPSSSLSIRTTTNSNNSSSESHNSIFERNRQKIKNRIIVGNISKWMPSFEDDNLTHKWMMYVRGPKESPDVSNFIEKVIFYLHPSYKPHDTVEVSEPPFHLSRRGWGEFPIRVQIHFRCTLNKPVDIVHNLKLDKTYSGRQTLGNESIIDLYLYDDNVNNSVKTYDMNEEDETHLHSNEGKKIHEIVAVTDICEKIKAEKDNITESEDSISKFEHDYCTDDIKNIVDDTKSNLGTEASNMDHCYSYPPTHEFLNIDKNKPIQYIEQEENALMYGLDETYSETHEDSIKKEPLYYRKTLVYTTKHLPTSSRDSSFAGTKGNMIGSKRKSKDTLLKRMFTAKICVPTSVPSSSSIAEKKQDKVNIESNEFHITLPKRIDLNLPKFKNIGEVLPYLFRRLPLVSELVQNPKYKTLYPFTASTLQEYLSWNIAKQSSAEWSRAKTIKNILAKEKVYDYKKWNTKAIMMYGRSHGYTPRDNFSLFEKPSAEKKLINSCFQSSIALPANVISTTDHSIDIENELRSPEEKRIKLSTKDASDPTLDLQCSFIREEALECGIVLKNELIDNNVVFNGAERMILEALKCFADHLVRRSMHHAVSSKCYGTNVGAIDVNHVQIALKERKEMEALEHFKNEQSKIKYFFQ